jgi:hypothetical protein
MACERPITGRERYCAFGAFFLIELERKLVSGCRKKRAPRVV